MSDNKKKFMAAALLFGVGYFIYALRRQTIQQLPLQKFKQLTAITEPVLVTGVPRAKVFEANLKQISSFRFGKKVECVFSFSKNIEG